MRDLRMHAAARRVSLSFACLQQEASRRIMHTMNLYFEPLINIVILQSAAIEDRRQYLIMTRHDAAFRQSPF